MLFLLTMHMNLTLDWLGSCRPERK